MSEQPDSAQPDPGPVEDADAGTDDALDTLDVAVAELRPALEAILMVSDEPLDKVRLASVVGHPVADLTIDEFEGVPEPPPADPSHGPSDEPLDEPADDPDRTTVEETG